MYYICIVTKKRNFMQNYRIHLKDSSCVYLKSDLLVSVKEGFGCILLIGFSEIEFFYHILLIEKF